MSKARTIRESHHHRTTCLDTKDPGVGGMCHEYEIWGLHDGALLTDEPFTQVKFQKGLTAESGLNGIYHEDLIAIVIHRLQGAQAGPFACSENAKALKLLTRALKQLDMRTLRRKLQDVDGLHMAHDSKAKIGVGTPSDNTNN